MMQDSKSNSSAAQSTPSAPGPWRWPLALKASAGLHAGAALASAVDTSLMGPALATVAGNHLAITAAGLWPRSRLLGANVLRLPETPAHVALTLDDGPDPEVTPRVLDLLGELGLKASFFVIGQRAHLQPALLRRAVAEGHEVHNHSMHHRHDFSLRGPAALRREIGDAQACIADITAINPTCFRAPAGLRNIFLAPVLHELGLQLVSWTRRGFDTRTQDASLVHRRLVHGLAGGDILLLHDGHAARSPNGRTVVEQVLPLLQVSLVGGGLGTVTLSAALQPRQ